jgi:hypothetical protein
VAPEEPLGFLALRTCRSNQNLKFTVNAFLIFIISCFDSLCFFTWFITEEEAWVYRSNSEFPIGQTPTKMPVSVLQNGKMFLYAEHLEYNIRSDFRKSKKKTVTGDSSISPGSMQA